MGRIVRWLAGLGEEMSVWEKRSFSGYWEFRLHWSSSFGSSVS